MTTIVKKKQRKFLCFLCFVLFLCTTGHSQIPSLPDSANFYDYLNFFYDSDLYDQDDTTEGGNKAQMERLKKNWVSRLYPHGDFSVANKAIINYANNFNSVKTKTVEPSWQCIGPNKNPTGSTKKV